MWDNESTSKRVWQLERQMQIFREKGRFDGVSDLMRYEILHEYGGFFPEADMECKSPVDELFQEMHDCYTSDMFGIPGHRMASRWTGSTLPLLAAVEASVFASQLISEASKIDKFDRPSFVTGNGLMRRSIEKFKPDIVVWPHDYFSLQDGVHNHSIQGKVYAIHHGFTSAKRTLRH